MLASVEIRLQVLLLTVLDLLRVLRQQQEHELVLAHRRLLRYGPRFAARHIGHVRIRASQLGRSLVDLPIELAPVRRQRLV